MGHGCCAIDQVLSSLSALSAQQGANEAAAAHSGKVRSCICAMQARTAAHSSAVSAAAAAATAAAAARCRWAAAVPI